MVQALQLNPPVISSEDETSSSESESSSPRQAVMRVQEQQPQTPLSRREARANEFAGLISDKKVIDTLNRTHMASKIKKAKTAKGMSYTQGEVSNKMDFRKSKTEMLLLDSGAQVNIVGEEIANDAKVKIYKLKQERFVTEASGNLLNIIGSCELFIKLPFVKSTKKVECLVLRGSAVDREILISCDMLLKWDLIHSTFGRETVTDYFHRNSTHYNSNSKLNKIKVKNVNSMSQLYNKSKISTDELLEKIHPECVKLREKILKLHKKNFKEKLGPLEKI